MFRLLPWVVLLASVAAVFVYFGLFKQKEPDNPVLNITESTNGKSDQDRIALLENAVLELANKTGNGDVANIDSSSTQKSSDLNSKISTLEVSIADLKGRVQKLEGGSAQTSSPTSTNKSPVYILSLGSGGSTTATDWTTINSISVTIDPAEFPGYSSMQLEASLKVLSGNGKAFARLHESSSGLSILSSEVSTNAFDYTWVSSQTFTVSSKKTYVFQLKSLTGYEAFIQSARVKVNF